MSFDLEEILEEFAEASGKGREWFDSASYGVIARAGRAKGRNRESLRAYKRKWMQEWRKRNPLLARLKDQAKYRRQKADAERLALRKQRWTKENAKRKASPDRARRARESALRAYYRRKAVAR